jgi:hypothetical protein
LGVSALSAAPRAKFTANAVIKLVVRPTVTAVAAVEAKATTADTAMIIYPQGI